MIGQCELIKIIDTQIINKQYPRCSIFIGKRGSGKKTLAKYVADKLGAECVIVDGKVAEVRNVIQLAHSSHLKTVFVFSDADRMSTNAENALLKLSEEPPNNAYIIITAQSTDRLLDTIRSRGVVYTLEPYTAKQIKDYYDSDIIVDVCENIGEVNELISAGIDEVYSYAELVEENIGLVTGANALKIGSRIALKDEKDKIDLTVFFKVFLALCNKKLDKIHAKWILITLDYLKQLDIKGVNKSMLFDGWVLACRQILF